MKHVKITVSGKVQGVFFRKSTQEEAYRLRIAGFVQNESNGNVYIEAEGEEEDLNEFIAWCKKGPKKAVVEDVKIKEGRFQDFEDFEIIYG